MEKISRIVEVRLSLIKSKPPSLLISAVGAVPTTGWSSAELSPYVYITPPQDGYWEFDFVARAPSGPAAEVITPIGAAYVWTKLPAGLKGIRVYASENKIEKPFQGINLTAGGGEVPFPW